MEATAESKAVAAELEAASAALSGSTRRRAKVALGALRALLANPDDTRQVFLIGIAANAGSFAAFHERFAASAEGARLLAEKPAIDGKVVERLRGLPASTLGGAYARYLDGNGLDADLFQAPPGLPQPAAYIAQRLRQTHDIWHVLTGYAPNVPGEVALQGFTFAQTRMPSAALIAFFGALKTLPRAPRVIGMTLEGYRRGRAAEFLCAVRWEDHFDRSLDEVRRDLGLEAPRRALS
jgi:ubiquinone biosynthesis protein COQ4